MIALRNAGIVGLILVTAVILTAFQNCVPNHLYSASSSSSTAASVRGGNGDGYDGKLTIFNFSDPSRPCAELGQNGKPLSNATIFVESSTSARLVREDCHDISGQGLGAGEFVFLNSNQLRYQSRVFDAYSPRDFDVVASACPAGRMPLNLPMRDNYFDSSFDLARAPWGTIGGMSSSIVGTIGGLPSSSLIRTVSAVNDSGIRVDQSLALKSGTSYALSFVAGRSSSPGVRLEMYGNNGSSGGLYIWDLANGGLVTNNPYGGLTNVSFSSRRFGGGWLSTLYFTTAATTNALDIGFAPSNFAVGDYVDVTAPQLEEVDAFCAK